MESSYWFKGGVALATACAPPVMAQGAALNAQPAQAEAATVDDIVITAQRREQRLQDVLLIASSTPSKRATSSR